MKRIGIILSENNDFNEKIIECYNIPNVFIKRDKVKVNLIKNDNINIFIAVASNSGFIKNFYSKLLIINNRIMNTDVIISSNAYVIINENIIPPKFFDKTAKYITCGFSEKNTVCISSVTDEKITISIQRKFFDVNDNLVDEQDIVIKRADKNCDVFYETAFYLCMKILNIV